MKPSVNGTPNAERSKRRIRSPHSGVVLLKPSGGHVAWRARYLDPDTGKMVKERLDPLALPNAQARRDWAIRKAKSIARRVTALAEGAVRQTGTDLTKTIEQYYEAHAHLREKTVKAYRNGTDKLLSWADEQGIRSADQLNRAALLQWRASVIAEPKRSPEKGRGKRGKRGASAVERSPYSINRELRGARTVLGYLVDADKFSRLSHEDLRRALKREKVSHERLDYLRPAALRQLLEAALRHDADTHTITREEHEGLRPVGTTPRYEPIAPFLCAVLLTGMRYGEALALQWEHVDLRALDLAGREVGEIHLPGETNKTHQARTIDLAVSPALRRLLAALKLRDGGEGPVFRLRGLDEDGKPIALVKGIADAAAKRLRGNVVVRRRGKEKDEKQGYGAPKEFTWQALRRTCGTFLTNAPGIFGAASAYRSARQLGHSVTIAEKHYVDLARGIPYEAKDLESAMQIADLVEKVIASVGGSEEASNVIAIGGGR